MKKKCYLRVKRNWLSFLVGFVPAIAAANSTVTIFEFKEEGAIVAMSRDIERALTEADIDLTGRVVDNSGNPLAGATVVVLTSNGRHTDLKTTTGDDGIFRLRGVANDAVLEVTYVGFERLTIKATSNLGDIALQQSSSQLDEIVVTGVAAATSRARLPFALSKVGRDSIGALDVTQTLRGRVAGLQVSQTEGDDGGSVVLRGAKTLSGNIAPLVVIDGFVTNLGLSEINPLDVESIEVVKGAAASALYGTRAEGGVIQVITKTGKGVEGGLRIVVDNEYGLNNIQRYPELTEVHPFQVDPDDEFGFAYSSGSTIARMLDYQDNGFSLNLHPYKNVYNNTEALLNNNEFYRNYISLATSGEKYNAYVSFENQIVGGVVEVVPANKRQSAKLNLQLRPVNRLEMDINLQYYHTEKPSSALDGGGYNTFFGSTLMFEPFIDLSAKNDAGKYNFKPHGFDVQGTNLENPLYEWSERRYKNAGDNILAGGKLKYRFMDNLALEVMGSISKRFYSMSNLYPKGFQQIAPTAKLSNGYLSLYNSEATQYNGQSMLSYHDTFGDFTFGANFKMVYEYDYANWSRLVGYDFSSPLYTIENAITIDQGSGTTGGSGDFSSKTVNYGWFLNMNTSYQDKLFLDVLGRIDQSSRYGSNAQNAFFPRISAAYRITKDVDLGAVNELKARLSYGQAGRLPGYGYKESVAVVTSSGISITRNENTNLTRSVTSEWEMGFDAQIWRKLNIQLTYATAKSSGDFVLPPVFTPYMGASPAYQNFGLISSNSIELEANGNIVNRKNFAWDAHLTFARTRSMIEELGQGLPPYVGSGLYWRAPGVSPYTFYGQKILRSLDQLEVVDGVVVNTAGGSQPLDNFTVNELGFVVLKSAMGTSAEAPLFLEKDGTKISEVMGDAQPNFTMGFGSSFTFFGNLSLSVNMDWKNGGQKYNQTMQYLMFAQRSKLWEDYAQTGVPLGFVQGVYNGNSYTDVWLESSSYLSLREVALAYSVPLPKQMGWFKSARIGLVGRNLYTWTSFTGTNPEGQYEYMPYPIYRTFTGKVTFTF